VLLLFGFVSTVSAECAWVLWYEQKPSAVSGKAEKDGLIPLTYVSGTDWTRYAAYATDDACWATIRSVTFVPREGSLQDQMGWLLHQISPRLSAYGRWMLWRRANGVEMDTFAYKCLPDTWDLRGPRAK